MAVRKPKSEGKRKQATRAKTRKTRVAARTLAGAKAREISAELGVSRRTIERDVAGAEVQQILALHVSRASREIESLFRECLRAIREALQAERFGLSKRGRKVNLGPDHYARLTAVQRFAKLVTAGRPTPKPTEQPNLKEGEFTPAQLEQIRDYFLDLYRQEMERHANRS